jgi:hypothetical protein
MDVSVRDLNASHVQHQYLLIARVFTRLSTSLHVAVSLERPTYQSVTI